MSADEPTDGWRPPAPSISTRTLSARSKGSARVTVIGPNDREILCESDLEGNACLCLLAHPDVVDVIEQPAPVSYVDDVGENHRHSFDFIAVMADGSRTAVVVKPAAKAERHGLKRLVQMLAAQTPRDVAQRFKLMTDKDLDPVRVHDAKLINAVRLDPDLEADKAMREMVRGLNGETTIGNLVARCGTGAVAFRAAVRLIAAGTLVRVGRGRLGYETAVVARGAF